MEILAILSTSSYSDATFDGNNLGRWIITSNGHDHLSKALYYFSHGTSWHEHVIPGPWWWKSTSIHMGHYDDVIMSVIASQITSLTIVCLTVNSGADQRKHQSSVSLAFVWGIHRWPVNSPHKGPVTRKMCPFDDVIMEYTYAYSFKTIKYTRI